MFKSLPEPNREQLSRPPVNLVLFSIGYSTAEPWSADVGLRWRESLKRHGFLGKLQTVNNQQTTVQQGVGLQLRSRVGHQVSQEHDGTTATLFEDSIDVQSTKYTSWTEFQTMLEAVIASAFDARKISVQNSLSLRYINALSTPEATSASYWRGKVRQPFLGPVADDSLMDGFKRGVYLLSYEDESITSEVRIGIQPDQVYHGCTAFVFDLEFQDGEPRGFATGSILSRSDDLNTAALKVFQHILEESHWEELKRS